MKRLELILIVLVITLASSWALLKPGFFRVHDYVHAARVAEMTRALQEGHFPVRWTRNFGYGYGMPLFEFYAPLPFYVGSALYMVGLPIVTTVKALFLVPSALTALGVYVLGRQLYGKLGGFLAAAAVTLAPYRALNLYVRGAISEVWGIMAMPWVLLGIVHVVRGKRWGWVVLFISLVVLLLSHNIMTMLFLPLSGLFALFYGGYHAWMEKDARWLKKVLVLMFTYTLSIGVTAFYTIPALAEKEHTQVDAIFSGYFHYSQHFLYVRQFITDSWGYTGSVWGPEDGISFFLGWGQLAGLVVTGFLALYGALKHFRKPRPFKNILRDRALLLVFIAGLLTVLSLFMTLMKSKPLWDALPLISFAQFPWRFLGPGVVFVGLLIGMSTALIVRKTHVLGWTALCFGLLLLNTQYFRPETYMSNPDELYYTDADRIQSSMSSILPDYIPNTMIKDPQPPAVRLSCGPLQKEFVDNCMGQARLETDKGHFLEARTTFDVDTQLNFAIADFPGWSVVVDGKLVEKKRAEIGTISVMIPSGVHQVQTSFGSTPIRKWSDVVSLLSLGIVGLAVVQTKKQSIA